jgi:tetratricopeptide (TPR) repeat protein
MPDQTIGLSVSESGSGSCATFSFHVRLDDEVIAANQALTVAQSQTVREMSLRYGQLFEQHRFPQEGHEMLQALGAQLFEFWLAGSWQKLSAKLRPHDLHILVVASDRASVLNLPWELLQPGESEAIGTDVKWGVRRLPWADRQPVAAADQLPAGPLRVFYMVSAQQDQTGLDFEGEEEFLLRALGEARSGAMLESGDLGGFKELGQHISSFRPHVVHLTGHGLTQETTAYFAFEDEWGATDERSACELGQLFAASGVQCVFLRARHAGKASTQGALGGLARELLAAGVPLVIGWTASILDEVATQVAGSFYGTVSRGAGVDHALSAARQTARKICEARGDPSWSLPVLYARTCQSRLFDTTRTEPGQLPTLTLQALPGIEAGYTPHFIGRRRELQRLLPALRTGELQIVLLTGLGGAGKSTLATRLARKLETEGWTPLALSSSAGAPLSAAQVFEVCGQAFLDAGQRDTYTALRDATQSVAVRLRSVVSGLNRGRFVLVLDDIESNVDGGTQRFLDGELAGFYRDLLEHLAGGSRLIVTCRYRPAPAALPATAGEWRLGEFGETAYLKFLFREPEVERRYLLSELPYELLVRLHDVLGATPRFLCQIRAVLATLPADELESELGRIVLPEATDAAHSGQLQAARDTYCETIFAGRLYGRLSGSAQQMLSRAAVFRAAVTIDGLAAVTGMGTAAVREMLGQWRALALAHVDTSGGRDLWSIYGMLRNWLLSPERLSAEARKAAHLAAGNFLVEMNREHRQGELGMSWVVCLLEARTQYLAAGALDKARTVTGRLSGFYARQGLHAELERLHQDLLCREVHPSTLTWLGRSYEDRAQYGPARLYYQRALELAGEADPNQASVALHGLATLDLNEGAYPAAREKSERALAMHQQIGDRPGEVITWNRLAALDANQGIYSAAREKFERALAMLQQLSDRAGEAITLHNLATIDLREGLYPAARRKFYQSLAIKQEIGDRAGEAATWHQLATLDLNEDAYPSAREKFERALAMRQQIGDRVGEAGIWHNLASLELKEGAYLEAREKFERALTMHQRIGDCAGEAVTWFQLGVLAVQLGNAAEGLRLVGLCYLIHRAIGHRNTDGDLKAVAQLAERLDYTHDQLMAVLQETSDSYANDKGTALLRQAFD